MAIFKLKTDLRDNLLKSYTKQLRKAGFVPGVYYKRNEKTKSIAVDKKELLAAIKKNAHIFQLDTGKETLQTIIKTVQWHPVTDEPIHIDFLGVNESEPIEISVKVVAEGLASGVKEQGGLLSQTVWHLQVRCFIENIPDKIVVDVTELKLGDSIAVKELSMENVEFVDSPEKSIVSVIVPKGANTALDEEEEEIEEEETEE